MSVFNSLEYKAVFSPTPGVRFLFLFRVPILNFLSNRIQTSKLKYGLEGSVRAVTLNVLNGILLGQEKGSVWLTQCIWFHK